MSAGSEFARALAARVRGRVDDDPVTRALYATDASLYEVKPRAVLRAAEPDDLAAAVETAAEHGVPITPRGAGTSLAGQAIGPGLVVDCSALRRVLSVDPEAGVARVQPGVVLDQLNEAAAPHGLWFGPDTATSNRCTLGGMIGNNSCGARSLLYGMTVDHVPSVECVMADGSVAVLDEAPVHGESVAARAWSEAARIAREHAAEIRARYPPIPRRASGYNLDRLLDEQPNLARVVVGSEGTLALVREARVRLVPRPPVAAAAALHFGALEGALEAARDLLALRPASVELIDRSILDLARASTEFSRFLGWVRGAPDAVLLVEFLDQTEAAASARLDDAERVARAAESVRMAEGEREHAWRVRRAGLPLLYSRPGRRRPVPIVEDVAVPPERMPEFVAAFRAIVARAGTTAAFYAHAAAGCLHVRPLFDPDDPADVRDMLGLQREVAALARAFGGAMSGEHGDGRARGHLLGEFFGPEIATAFATLKAAFDPAGLFNPGIIVDPPDPAENLRRAPAGGSVLSFPEGVGAAAGRCFGAGACLKASGAMCPSYMATRAEEDSTRARANALRALLSGEVPAAELHGRRLHEVMDLCVGCKACKAECPAGVDVAALKVEYLARLRRSGKTPVRARLFGRIDALARAGSRAPALANAFARGALGRALAGRLGIAGPPPPLAPVRFSRWFRERREQGAGGDPLTLFADTFTEHFHPEVGRAAVRVIEAAGYAVDVVAGVCCGRPAISLGHVEHARRAAERAAAAIERARGPVVFLEPSCHSAVADDYPLLGVRAPRPLLFDELVAGARDRFGGVLDPGGAEALVHVHCHQRALRGHVDAVGTAALCGPARFVDAGCCGMAGSFGYEKEHREISRRMAERVLLPAARAAAGPVVAAGSSCRQQLAALGRVRALHPAELLAGHLVRP